MAPVPVPQQQNEPKKQEEVKPQKVEQNVSRSQGIDSECQSNGVSAPKEVSAKASLNIPPVETWGNYGCWV